MTTMERLSFRNAQPGNAIQRETVRLHKERYRFAGRFVRGARVLDIACGSGYGSRILRESGATEVIGVDVSPEAVAEAQELHRGEGIRFVAAHYRDLAQRSVPAELLRVYQKGFDVVVTLETIEHLPDPSDFVSVLVGGLKRVGLLVASVPVTPSMDANPYHLHDFSPASFRRLLKAQGLETVDAWRQVQRYNPLSVRRQMRDDLKRELRPQLARYYLSHPGKLGLRLWSTVRYGFVNLVDVVAARMAHPNP